MRPAISPALLPDPINKSPLTIPRIAPPVSCATTKREISFFSIEFTSGNLVSIQIGRPKVKYLLSIANERPSVKETPCAPIGPSVVSNSLFHLKNIYDGFSLIKSWD